MKLVFFLLLIAIYTGWVFGQNIPDTWTQSQSPWNTYQALASSTSGDFLASAGNHGSQLISSGNPLEWSYTSCPDQGRTLYCIAISGDGQFIITGTQYFDPYVNSQVFLSADYGKTWSQTDLTSDAAYSGLAMSTDGQYMYATSWCDTTYGYGSIYYSHNYGVSWTTVSDMDYAQYNSVACSANGTFVAVVYSGAVWLSKDYGVSFTQPTAAPSTQYLQIADGGVIWFQANTLVDDWVDITSTSSGQVMYATNYAGVYYTEDYGTTWDLLPTQPPADINYCTAITTDSAGTQIAAACYPFESYSDYENGTIWIASVGAVSTNDDITTGSNDDASGGISSLGGNDDSDSSSTTGLIAGLVVAGVVAAGIIAAVSYYMFYRGVSTLPSSKKIGGDERASAVEVSSRGATATNTTEENNVNNPVHDA